ncbi:RHS repeat protein, partial [Aggregatibacter actinomycetemcomitans]|uniref:DUF6531 domain-containing protein n=1 Tax=Aggregatibacter actinomycetemcomitans TaxID=714 RepID=UPI00197B7152
MGYYFPDKTTSILKHHNSLQDITTAGEPIDIATGDYLQQWQLIDLSNSLLPLKFTRVYRSTSEVCGHLGQKWSDDWSQSLSLQADSIIFTDNEGVQYTFYAPGETVFATHLHAPNYVLYGRRNHSLYLFDRKTQHTYIFENISVQPEEKRYLTWITDYFGNYIHLDYDENGLAGVTHSNGCFLRIRSKNWLIEEVEYFDGQVNQQLLRCEYNPSGQLIYCHSQQFGETFHDYDENGYMVSWRDTQATQTDIGYDVQGRVISTQASGGYYADRFVYDEVNRCTTYYDAEGGISRYWYNENALVIKEEDPLGRIKKVEWDLSLKMSETDALGRTVAYRYNDYGDLIEVILPNEEKLQYRYNERGLLTERVLANGECWHYEYDNKGALSKLVSPYGLVWHYQYDEKGRLIRLDYPDENYQSYEYDEHTYQPVGQRDSRGEITYFRRDLFGRITQLILPDNSQYHYEYSQVHANPNGSLTRLTTPEG